jgi:hypothetical protein
MWRPGIEPARAANYIIRQHYGQKPAVSNRLYTASYELGNMVCIEVCLRETTTLSGKPMVPSEFFDVRPSDFILKQTAAKHRWASARACFFFPYSPDTLCFASLSAAIDSMYILVRVSFAIPIGLATCLQFHVLMQKSV